MYNVIILCITIQVKASEIDQCVIPSFIRRDKERERERERESDREWESESEKA